MYLFVRLTNEAINPSSSTPSYTLPSSHSINIGLRICAVPDTQLRETSFLTLREQTV